MASYSETRQGIGFPDWVIVRGSARLFDWIYGINGIGFFFFVLSLCLTTFTNGASIDLCLCESGGSTFTRSMAIR